MRIGFDISQTGEDKAGCGYFADSLIQYLTDMDRENKYILYPHFGTSFWDPEGEKTTRNIKRPNVSRIMISNNFHESRAFWKCLTEKGEERIGNPDIVHANNFSCPRGIRRAKVIYTLYDISFLINPEFTTEQNRLVCFDGIFNASIYADHCIAISEHTKKSFLDFFPYYFEDRITVIRLGTRPTIKLIKSRALKEKILNKFNLTDEFWLSVGTIEPRKNYKQLIEAYSALNDRRLLVIAGGRGWLETGLAEKVKQLDIHDRVRFLGYVSDEELSALYSACFAFIYPSYYEGFGLPVLEAMSCGAAVITSVSSSLPEVGGNAVLYIDPRSKVSLVKKMKLLIDNQSLLHELRMKSRKRAMRFSWSDAARKTLQVYKETLKNKPPLKK